MTDYVISYPNGSLAETATGWKDLNRKMLKILNDENIKCTYERMYPLLVITRFDKSIFTGKDFEGLMDPCKEHDTVFRAYDDDCEFYYTGTCFEEDSEDAFEWAMRHDGVTFMKIYDRKTGNYIDTLN